VSIDSKHHEVSIDVNISSSYKITMEKTCPSPAVPKNVAPTAKLIAALADVAKMQIYQHAWLDASNLVKIMTHQFLSEYHENCNIAWKTTDPSDPEVCSKVSIQRYLGCCWKGIETLDGEFPIG
jgi:hypothetical protein